MKERVARHSRFKKRSYESSQFWVQPWAQPAVSRFLEANGLTHTNSANGCAIPAQANGMRSHSPRDLSAEGAAVSATTLLKSR